MVGERYIEAFVSWLATCTFIIGVPLLDRAALAGDWPQWRGPAGAGVSDERDLPLAWNETNGIAWKTPLVGWGNSTPAIWKDAIFVTSQDDESLLLSRIHKKTGKIEWTQKVGAGAAPRKATGRGEQKFHDLHNLASPSPVTDGKIVVAHFGNGDLAAYDFSGKLLWRRNLQDDHGKYTIWWGHSNSPVLHKDLVISACMQDSLADMQDKPVQSYLVAHELTTGKVRWHAPRTTSARAEECDSYTTPLVVASKERGAELVVMGGNQVDGYDPAAGKQMWTVPGLVGGRTVTSPTIAGDMLFAVRGMRGPLTAIDLSRGVKPSRQSIAWEFRNGSPDSCSPVFAERLLFTVTDDGIARCFDAAVGTAKWQGRIKGNYKASPIAADGRVYFLNTKGLCTVISATPRLERLTENQLDDETIASPAVSDRQIFIRGRKSLYCVRK